MAGKFRTRDIDKGAKKIRKELNKIAKGRFVKVGFLAQKNEPHKGDENTSATVLEIAIFNEFGTDKIPERSFVRSSFDENKQSLNRLTDKVAGAVLDRKISMERSLDLLGLEIQNNIKKKIAKGVSPENSPATIARKGSSKPLVDTGQMEESVTFVQEKGDPKKL